MTGQDTDSEEESHDRIGTEPIDGDGVYPFAGLTRFDEDVDAMTLPENVWRDTSSMKFWAQEKTDHSFEEGAGVDRDLDPSVLPARGLSTMISELPRASLAEVQWVHPRTGETYRTAKHNAVINPDTAENVEWGYGTKAEVISEVTGADIGAVREDLEEMGLDTYLDQMNNSSREEVEETTVGEDALYHIPTDEYQIINPSQFLRPLCDVIRSEDLAGACFGEVRLSRGGGRASADIYFDGKHVDAPNLDDDRPPIVVGLNVQWDFFGDWAVRAQGVGMDWACTNHIRQLTEREIVKHSGDIESRVDWIEMWEELLESIDLKTDQLSQIIQQASETSLDLSDLPTDLDHDHQNPWQALYAYMGLPDYLAEYAGSELQANAEDPYNPSWWQIHRGATYAVTHHSRSDMDSGGSIEEQNRVANDMLMNPPAMEETIVENYAKSKGDDEVELAEEGGGVAEIQNAFETVREKRDEFEDRQNEIQQLIQHE